MLCNIRKCFMREELNSAIKWSLDVFLIQFLFISLRQSLAVKNDILKVQVPDDSQ